MMILRSHLFITIYNKKNWLAFQFLLIYRIDDITVIYDIEVFIILKTIKFS